jgi:hypothetical protein
MAGAPLEDVRPVVDELVRGSVVAGHRAGVEEVVESLLVLESAYSDAGAPRRYLTCSGDAPGGSAA